MVVGVLLAASTGIVGATVVTLGLLALPSMLQRGYDPAGRLRRHMRVRHLGADNSTFDRPGPAG